jgi:hypothetical protein
MALSDEQKDFLSNLEPGRVILSSSGMSKPLQVQIKELVSTTNERDVSPQDISQLALSYYAKNFKSGLIQGLELLDEHPSNEDVEQFLHGEIAQSWYDTVGKEKDRTRLIQYIDKFGWEFMHQYISLCCYNPSSKKDKETREATLYDFLSSLNEDSEIRISMHQRDEFGKDIKVIG